MITDADRELARELVDRARDPEVPRELVEHEVAASLAAERQRGRCAHSSTPHTIRGRRVCPDCGAPR